MNNLRRMMAGYDVPATAQKITTTNYSDLSGNVIYIPLQSPANSTSNVKRRTLYFEHIENEKILINGLVADNVKLGFDDMGDTGQFGITIENNSRYSSELKFGVYLEGVKVGNSTTTVRLTPGQASNANMILLAPEDDQCVYYKIKFATPKTPANYREWNFESNDVVMPFYIDNED